LNLKWPNQSLTSVGAKTYVVWVDSKNVVKVSCLDRATDPITEQAVPLDDAYTGPRNDGHMVLPLVSPVMGTSIFPATGIIIRDMTPTN
jgi:hypothetical protein